MKIPAPSESTTSAVEINPPRRAWKLAVVAFLFLATVAPQAAAAWKVGTPIATYWAGPAITDSVARQMAEGGFNLIWCNESELETAQRHGLRALLTDPLLLPANLDRPADRARLDELIARVKAHPALYAYFLTDEPSTAQFAALGRLVAYLRERDPEHLAYINLFPTYASNEQLGTRGDTVTAYEEHLRQYLEKVKPSLISYDHYQFTTKGDSAQYFLNLAIIRRTAQTAGVPFLNIVQASSWAPSMRVPNGDETRYLVYTSLAYGAQGISYYVYRAANHKGGIANADGTPTPIYDSLKVLNREFVTVAAQLQPLRSLGIYHAGMMPPGAEPLPAELGFALDPPLPTDAYKPPQPVKGVAIGCFGPAGEIGDHATPTHALVVNLDYLAAVKVGLRCPGGVEILDPSTAEWRRVAGGRIELELPPGGGKLVRIRK